MINPKAVLFVDSHCGIYSPQTAIQRIGGVYRVESDTQQEVEGLMEDIAKGPESENYWESWMEFCDFAVLVDSEKNRWTIEHDEDIWLVPEGELLQPDEDELEHAKMDAKIEVLGEHVTEPEDVYVEELLKFRHDHAEITERYRRVYVHDPVEGSAFPSKDKPVFIFLNGEWRCSIAEK